MSSPFTVPKTGQSGPAPFGYIHYVGQLGLFVGLSSIGILGACAHTETTTERTERTEHVRRAASTRRAESAASSERKSEAAATKRSETAAAADTAHGSGTAAEAPSLEATEVASEEQASYVTEVQFAQGSALVTPEYQEKITKLVDKARGKGRIDDIKVVAWADEEYPTKQVKVLSPTERALADNRGKELKKILTTLEHTIPIQTYNMAERPNTLAELAGTANARIKKTLEAAGASTKKAATAMVMLIVK